MGLKIRVFVLPWGDGVLTRRRVSARASVAPEIQVLALLEELERRMQPLAAWVAAQPRHSKVECLGRQLHLLLRGLDRLEAKPAVERLRSALLVVRWIERLHEEQRREMH